MKNRYIPLLLTLQTGLFSLLGLTSLIGNTVIANELNIEPVHYAYANYLGSGIYKTTGQNVSLINLPFSYEVGQKGKTTYGFRLPLSVGFFDFSYGDIPNLNLPSNVGTLTFTPGIEFSHQVNDNFVLETYLDFGYAKNLTTNRDVTVHSAGISSLYYFNVNQYDTIWANRLYYAGYEGTSDNGSDLYAAIQTGIDIGLPLHYEIFDYRFQPRIFTSVFWYFNEARFELPKQKIGGTEHEVTLTNSVEVGFTLKLDKKIGYSWAGIDRIGLSYRYSKNINVFRLLFSFPI